MESEGGCFDETSLKNISHDVLSALSFLSDNKIIHRLVFFFILFVLLNSFFRDVKPANVLINHKGGEKRKKERKKKKKD